MREAFEAIWELHTEDKIPLRTAAFVKALQVGLFNGPCATLYPGRCCALSRRCSCTAPRNALHAASLLPPLPCAAPAVRLVTLSPRRCWHVVAATAVARRYTAVAIVSA